MLAKSYPSAYVDFLFEFHGPRDYFECHEILEEYWKEHPHDPLREIWHGLIQVAVGLYHQRIGNLGGAQKMLTSAIFRLQMQDCSSLSIERDMLVDMLSARLELFEQQPHISFSDLDLPIEDPQLIDNLRIRSEQAGFAWRAPSNMANRELLYRHTLRDRTDVIEARKSAFAQRNGGRS